ncbi:hypothetical protein TWF730_007905 [Orbilia blumenaviensis]|uniref:NACHT domain-containing protein n=1 Tax=Orbilia blumenaviensis TaxID=1796055 RepID=A0AAV9VBM8_9PEZI
MSLSGSSRLEKSIEDFKLSLKPEDYHTLKNYLDPSAEDVTTFVKDLDERLQEKQKRRAIQSPQFTAFLRSMQQFSSIVDTCIQSNPEIAALIWGGIKFVLLAFSNYTKYLEEIANMCEKMGCLCPQFKRFSNLFPSHRELQDAICGFYAIVVDFFREALLFLYSSVLKQFAIAAFRPFEEKFGNILKALDLARETIDKEITLSSEQELHVDRVKNAQLRLDVRDLCHFTRANYQYYHDGRVQISEEARRSKKERVLRNISRYPYYSDFTNNLHKRIENSGQWIYKTFEYKSWFNSTKSSGLWYYAIPGFGKSVLTAGVIDSLLELSRSSRVKRQYVAYFFCTYTTASSLLANTILLSLLHQLFYYSQDLPKSLVEDLEARFEDKVSASRVALTDIQRFLTQIIEKNQSTNYIVVDGLDECNDKERGTILRTLRKILEDVPQGVKILISSRGSQDIVLALQTFQQLDLRYSNQEDIEAFISKALHDKELEGQLPKLTPELRVKVTSFLVENARGLFIWVDLQIEEICKEARPEDIEAVLPILPRDLDELYDRIVSRIVRLRRSKVAREIFKWVAYAIRPLTLEELKEAASLGDKQLSSWADLHKLADVDESKWLQNCENLVVVNRVDRTVQFAHSTVRDFLKSGKSSESLFSIKGLTHGHLAEACVQYYKFPEIIGAGSQQRGTAVSKRALDSLIMVASNPCNYSPENNSSWAGWMTQKFYELTPRLIGPPLYAPTSTALVRTGDSTIISSRNATFKYILRAYPLLEYATSSWLLHFLEYSQQREAEMDPLRPDEICGISTLALQRFQSIRFPWQTHFRPDSVTFEEGLFELLDWILENGLDGIFEFLRRCKLPASRIVGIDEHAFLKYWLPIDYMSGSPSETRFEKLCYKKDLDAVGMWGSVLEAVEYDVDEPAFPRFPGGRLSKEPTYLLTHLQYACERSDHILFDTLMRILKQLFKAVDKRDRQFTLTSSVQKTFRFLPCKYLDHTSYRNMVRKSIEQNSVKILEALHTDEFYDFVSQVPQRDKFEFLYLATEIGKSECFMVLIPHHRFGLTASNDNGYSILQRAAIIGDVDIVNVCVRQSSDLSSRTTKNMSSPFQLAAIHDHLPVIKAMIPFLHPTKANVDMVAPRGSDTALTYAIKNKNVEMARVLLEAGAEIGMKKTTTKPLPESQGYDMEIPWDANYPMLQFSATPSVEILDVFLLDWKIDFLESLLVHEGPTDALIRQSKRLELLDNPARVVISKIALEVEALALETGSRIWIDFAKKISSSLD